MPQMPEQPGRVHHVVGLGVKIVTGAAALATVLGYVHSVGLDGSTTRRTIGTLGAAWVGLTPTNDTAFAIGDTLHLAATVTDRHGTALVGATMTWSSTDSSVATVQDGLVVAHAPGTSTIVATVGELISRAIVVVAPRVAALHLASDSAVMLAEGETRAVSLRTTDARGHVLDAAGHRVTWRSGDSVTAVVDSLGRVTGATAGRTTISASIGGVSAQMPVTVVPLPGALTLASGAGQAAPAGTLLPSSVVVRLVSRRGHPMAGATVRFRRIDGGGAVDLPSASTDADGKAHIVWRLGDFPGRQHLVASVDGLDSTATVDAEAEPVAANTRIAVLHDSLQAPIASALSQRVGIRLTDSTGRALADVPVRWELASGGTVTALAPRSDSVGVAEAQWVLGPTAGVQRLRAYVGNGRLVKPAFVHALATAGPPAALRITAGANQHASSGATLSKPIVLRVVDAAGNPVPGLRVRLSLSAGVVPDSTPVSDSSGSVRIHWTLPRATRTDAYHLSAHVDGIVQPLDIMATGVVKPSAPARHLRRA